MAEATAPAGALLSPLPATPEGGERWRVLVGAGLGNTLEWYDWSAYAIFAPFLATQFFKQTDQLSAFLSTLAVFAVGFATRPLGGVFFGWLADRKGRRTGMLLTMSITTLGSTVIALSPTYDRVGTWASLLLLVARLAQGFGLGGEIGASHTFLAESAPPARRGLWSSSMYVSITFGVLLSTSEGAILGTLLSKEQMSAWGWRIRFALGAILGIYAVFLRGRLRETPLFRPMHAQNRAARAALAGLWTNRGAVLRCSGLVSGGTVMAYAWNIAAPAYAIKIKGMDPTGAFWAATVANVLLVVVLPLWGLLSDSWGRRPNLILFALALAALDFPLGWLVRDQAWQLGVAMSAALLIMGAGLSIVPALFGDSSGSRGPICRL